MSEPVFALDDVSITLPTDAGDARIVRNLTLSVPRGGTLGIVGESGCGKSMTALAAMRLLPDRARISGQILLEGSNIAELPEREMCRIRGNRIGMVFQEPMTALNPAHPIGHQVAESLKVHGRMEGAAARAEALRLLEIVGIPHAAARFNDHPHQFSGGQRQRVVIAIALACQPALLIADEPTTALDVTVQAQILDLLDDLVARMGMSLILISHDLGVVGRLCDDLVVMYAGEAVETGSTARVFDEPSHPYTRGLFSALPELQEGKGGPLATIPGIVPSPLHLPQGCKFAGRCPFAIPECTVATPPLIPMGGGQWSRCIRAHELGPWRQ
jgi:peptide/nickel transport system ATP-binding protein